MSSLDPSVASAVASACGRPCWNVRQGHGTFLTFELGDPVVTHMPAIPALFGRPAKPPRDVTHGAWHLWIYCCDWSLADRDETLLADSDSPREVAAPHVARLDGLALRSVEIDPATSETEITFDDGFVLQTLPWLDDAPHEQWTLYLPGGDVLSIRSDGQFALGPGDRTERAWRPLSAVHSASMRLLWPVDGPRAGEGPPEAFVLFETSGGRSITLGSNLEYEVWLDGEFAGDGGHRCADGEAALDVWDATGASRVLVRARWIDPTRTVLYNRRAFADPFVAIEGGEDLGAWRCALDAAISITPTKVSDQLARQNVVLGPPATGTALALGPAALARTWACVDLGIRRPRVVEVTPREVARQVGAATAVDLDAALDAEDLASAPARWAKDGLPAGVACTTLDLGELALHRVETSGPSPVLVCWAEVPAFADAWATSNRVQVRMVDAARAGARCASFGWRGGRYVHALHRADAAPAVRAWRREYPLDWRDEALALAAGRDPRDATILAACRRNLLACVDGGLVDTCWRERGQWTGDLRMSALALRALATNDEAVSLALRQIAGSYVEDVAMVQAVWPASPPREPLFIPGYHLAFCLAALEHGLARLPDAVASLVRRSLEAWRARYLRADGLLDGFPATSWWFVDWDPQRATPSPRPSAADAVTHAWFHEACLAVGLPGLDVAAFERVFWTGSAYRVDLGGPESPQATAAAVSALPTSPHREAAIDWLLAEHAAGRIAARVTPYFAYFVAKAVGARSRALMLGLIRDLYAERALRWGTIPEKTTDGASLAHGWSVGVAALLV